MTELECAMFFALAVANAFAAPSRVNDICLAMIPPRLAAQLERDHPGYALPLLTDAPVDRLMALADSGGWPCPFVAIGDFDGDGTLDRAILLKSQTDSTVRLIGARNEGGHWRADLQKDWPIKIAAAQLEPLEPGLYDQTKGGRDAAKQLDDLKTIESDHPGFYAGPLEGARRAFFFTNGAWQDIWLMD
jgi:hypothetical protein